MTRTLIFTLAAFVLGLPNASRAQTALIKGRVVDTSRAPLPGANIFVVGTTIGAASAADGSFSFDARQFGRIELAASMVGYRTESKVLQLEADEESRVTFVLSERVFRESEVVVEGRRPKQWDRQYRRFEQELLGTSQNAESCSIRNPYVLDFYEDTDAGTLQAFATEPLIIDNPALGYELTFILEDFLLTSYPYSIRYKGRPLFRDLVADSLANNAGVQERRLQAYNGSFRHFLVALTRKDLEQEGFRVGWAKDVVKNPDEVAMLPTPQIDTLMTRGQADYEKLVYSPGVLHVTYEREQEPARYRRFVREVTGGALFRKKSETSYLRFDHGVTVHATGYVYEPYAVTTDGYWTWERLGDLLPRDYRPE